MLNNSSIDSLKNIDIKEQLMIDKIENHYIKNGNQIELKFFMSLPEEIRKNKNIIKYILSRKQKFLSHSILNNIDISLRNDKEICELIIENSGLHGSKLFSKELKNNREFIMYLLNKNINNKKIFNIQFISKELRNDEELMLLGIKCSSWNFVHCSQELKNNIKIVETVLKIHPLMIYRVSDELRKEREITKMAVKKGTYNNYVGTKYIEDIFKNDEEIMKISVSEDGKSLIYGSEKIKDNKEIAMIRLENNSFRYNYLSKRLKNDKDIIEKTLKSNGNFLSKIPFEYKKKLECVLWSFNSQQINFELDCYIEEDFLEVLEMYKTISFPKIIKNIHPSILTKENILKIIDIYPNFYFYLDNKNKRDLDIIKKSLLKNPEWMFKYIPEKEKNSIEIMKIILEKNPELFNKKYKIKDKLNNIIEKNYIEEKYKNLYGENINSFLLEISKIIKKQKIKIENNKLNNNQQINIELF